MLAEAGLTQEQAIAELREQFIAVLGHDLRNPLASIDGGTRMLTQEELSVRAQKIVALMQGSVARMSGSSTMCSTSREDGWMAELPYNSMRASRSSPSCSRLRTNFAWDRPAESSKQVLTLPMRFIVTEAALVNWRQIFWAMR